MMVMGRAVGSWARGFVDWQLWWMLRSQGQKTGLLATPFQRRLDGDEDILSEGEVVQR